MINFRSFLDEVEKLAAVKSRQGRTPIRVHNLVKKEVIDKSNNKLAALTLSSPWVSQVLPAVGLFGAGMLTANALSQAKRDWEIGRQMRQQGMV